MSARAAAPSIPAVILAVAAMAALYAWAVVAMTPSHPGAVGMNMNALGTDFMVFYSGARWFFDGNLAQLFDGERFTAYLNAAFSWWLSQPIAFRPWVYPPNYLLAMLPFGTMPFVLSYVVFEAGTAALLAVALMAGTAARRHGWIIAATAVLGPAAALNVAIGQNAFLMAALLVGGFRLLPARPAFGGAVLGLLTVKPQFWLLVPVALAALRAWKALAWSTAAGAALVALSVAVFGIEAWRHWIDFARSSYGDAAGQWVALGRLWGDSLYACLATAGLPDGPANAVQFAGTLLAIGLVYAAFRRPLATNLRIAIVLAATILASPHSSLSDSVFLGAAVGLWLGETAGQDVPLWQWTLALALWIAPLVNPPIVSPVGRLTPLLVLGFIALAMTARRPAPVAGLAAATPS